MSGVEWNDAKADKLRVMLEASIQRRFPQGLKVHVRALQTENCLTELAQRLRAANLSITRAKVLHKIFCSVSKSSSWTSSYQDMLWYPSWQGTTQNILFCLQV